MIDKYVRPDGGARVRVLPINLASTEDVPGNDEVLATVGRWGTVVGYDGAWVEVVIDGDTTPFLYLPVELDVAREELPDADD